MTKTIELQQIERLISGMKLQETSIQNVAFNDGLMSALKVVQMIPEPLRSIYD